MSEPFRVACAALDVLPVRQLGQRALQRVIDVDAGPRRSD